jgi:hypothetical protein
VADALERLQKQRAARIGWANTRNRTQRTAPGRAAFLEKLADERDPNHEWSEAERRAAAEQALTAHMLDMSRLAAEARKAKAKKNGNGR